MLANISKLRHKGTIILSPHSDDAALSIGGSLCKRIFEEPITLITVFGRSNYLRETAFHDDWEMVTATRKYEDAAFANALNIKLRYLEFPEASLRRGSSYNEIFSDIVHTDTDIPLELLPTLKQIVDNECPTFLMAPLGLGFHRDHLLIGQLSHKLALDGVPVVVYYEDLPYAASLSDMQILQHVSSVSSALTPVYISIGNELTCKLNNLKLYRSQIGIPELNAVRRYANHWRQSRFYERLWTSDPFTPISVD